jgi:hypothetical protein
LSKNAFLALIIQTWAADFDRQAFLAAVKERFKSEAECIACGYDGYMGLIKRTKPLHENGLFKLMAFLSNGGPVRNLYAASSFLGGVAKNILQCPNCGTTLEQEVGRRPILMLFGGR